jgi:hypothetical protein
LAHLALPKTRGKSGRYEARDDEGEGTQQSSADVCVVSAIGIPKAHLARKKVRNRNLRPEIKGEKSN